jgi:hypothetical protein
MRRLQVNLGYLADHVQHSQSKQPNRPMQPGPAIMHPPGGPPELVELYTKLQALYPGWKGQPNQMKSSPGLQQRVGSMSQSTGAGMSPVNNTGLQSPAYPINSAGQTSNLKYEQSNNMQQAKPEPT